MYYLSDNKMSRLSIFLVLMTIFVSSEINVHVNAYRTLDIENVKYNETIVSMEYEPVDIVCKTEHGTRLTYCGFIDPKGKRFSFASTKYQNLDFTNIYRILRQTNWRYHYVYCRNNTYNNCVYLQM